jgi:hypothetical protein
VKDTEIQRQHAEHEERKTGVEPPVVGEGKEERSFHVKAVRKAWGGWNTRRTAFETGGLFPLGTGTGIDRQWGARGGAEILTTDYTDGTDAD